MRAASGDCSKTTVFQRLNDARWETQLQEEKGHSNLNSNLPGEGDFISCNLSLFLYISSGTNKENDVFSTD